MFRPASGKLIPNKGQLNPRLVTESGNVGSVNFQAADVEAPLLAVSDIGAKGNPTWFDGETSYILPGKAPEIKEIRRLIEKVNQKIKLHLKNGTYKLRTWDLPTNPFQGQGW